MADDPTPNNLADGDAAAAAALSANPPSPSPFGSAAAGTPPAAAAQGIPQSAPNSFSVDSPEVYQQFVSALPDELKGHQMFKETKSLKALADQALNAQRMLGTKRLEAPSEDWDDNKWNEFYDHLRPKTVDDYSVPEKYEFGEGDKKSELALDDESKGTLKELAHKLGLSQKQFQGLAEKYAEAQYTGQAGIQESINEAVTKAIGSVKAEWGDTFDTNMKMAFEAYGAFSEEIPELKELMDWSPYVANHPAMLKLFHKLSGLTQDTGMFKGGMGGGMNDSSVGGIKAQISALETENADLLLHKNPSELLLSDRKRRDQLLETRTKLYEKLYG